MQNKIRHINQGKALKITSEASTLLLKKPERSGGIFLAKTFSFGSFSFWSQKENERYIINMNGRMYDPIVGRFLSPDRYVQNPTFTQSFNRYAYVINNPLRYIDPSGWTFQSAFENWDRVMAEHQQLMLAIDGGCSGSHWGSPGSMASAWGVGISGFGIPVNRPSVEGMWGGTAGKRVSFTTSISGNTYWTNHPTDISDFVNTFGAPNSLFRFFMSGGMSTVSLSTVVNVRYYSDGMFIRSTRDMNRAWREIEFHRSMASMAHRADHFFTRITGGTTRDGSTYVNTSGAWLYNGGGRVGRDPVLEIVANMNLVMIPFHVLVGGLPSGFRQDYFGNDMDGWSWALMMGGAGIPFIRPFSSSIGAQFLIPLSTGLIDRARPSKTPNPQCPQCPPNP